MKDYLSRQILLFFAVFSYLISQDCTIINTDSYGDCDNQLGYVWTGNFCSIVYGCDMGNDDDYSLIPMRNVILHVLRIQHLEILIMMDI